MRTKAVRNFIEIALEHGIDLTSASVLVVSRNIPEALCMVCDDITVVDDKLEGYALSFSDSFDIVIAFDILHDCEDIMRMSKIISRFVCGHGFLYISDIWNRDYAEGDMFRFSPEGIGALFGEFATVDCFWETDGVGSASLLRRR